MRLFHRTPKEELTTTQNIPYPATIFHQATVHFVDCLRNTIIVEIRGTSSKFFVHGRPLKIVRDDGVIVANPDNGGHQALIGGTERCCCRL